VGAGSYTVTVTDGNNCITTITETINQPTALTLTPTAINANCGQSDGSVDVTVTGGTINYGYVWNDPSSATTSSVAGLPAASYTVTVTDGNSCTETATIPIGNNTGGTLSVVTDNDVSCFGDSNGQATATMTGGTTPFTFLWSNDETSATATGFFGGTASVTLTDGVGCINITTTPINEPTLLNASIVGSTDVLLYRY